MFVPKRLKGTAGHTHCFCVTSQSEEDGKKAASTTCTLLAASGGVAGWELTLLFLGSVSGFLFALLWLGFWRRAAGIVV